MNQRLALNFFVPNRAVISIILGIIFYCHSIGQNLIPNGDFEIGQSDCAIFNLEADKLVDDWFNVWYGVNSGLSYIRSECINNYPTLEPFDPYSGKAYVSLSGAAYVNGTLSSDFIAVELNQPMEADKTYYLELFGRSKGIWHPSEVDLLDCLISPPRDLSIYFAEGREAFEVQEERGAALLLNVGLQNNLEPIYFEEKIQITSGPTNWKRYSTCYNAKGGERFMGISGPLRKFEVFSPCQAISDEKLDTLSQEGFSTNRFFHFFNFDIDGFTMLPIPEKFTVEQIICPNQENDIEPSKLLPELSILEEAIYRWPDETEANRKSINEAGVYEIEIILPCKIIPLVLTIIADDCPAPFFVPNVFSPNQDGVNDLFLPFLGESYALELFTLSVYDRWGGLVFSSKDPTKGWDGKYSNGQLTAGVYVWVIEYEIAGWTNPQLESGTVVLVP